MMFPDCFKQMFLDFLSLLPVLLLSAMGGAVAYLNKPGDNFSWIFLFVNLLTAAFVGVIMHFMLQSTTWHPGVQAAAVGLSGYASRDVLFLLKRLLLKHLCKRNF